ncbi:DUF5677 domain-containing protein [Limosilactobacillus gorillae]|uniref:DUF5677 domain-containing protein n=1 Tax=Limosilactobacillus gorillae TaxID=1450649 RepID=UPI000B851EED|nr:DUF5677 domain-containing protein [Limosilactobacillus gorillae]
MINTTKVIAKKAESNVGKLKLELEKQGELEKYDLLILLTKYMIDLYSFEVNYQSNQSVSQIISRTVMETYLYIRFLTKSKKEEYKIKKQAYSLIAQKNDLNKTINSLYKDKLIDVNNHKDLLRRDKAREIADSFNINETRLDEEKKRIDTEIKEFLEKNSDIKPKEFKKFYSISRDRKGKYLQTLQDLALYVSEGELYNLLMSPTSERVHATNIYNEYNLPTLTSKSNQDDDIPVFLGAIFVRNALKEITNFCNKKSLFDENLGKCVDNLKYGIQNEIGNWIR